MQSFSSYLTHQRGRRSGDGGEFPPQSKMRADRGGERKGVRDRTSLFDEGSAGVWRGQGVRQF